MSFLDPNILEDRLHELRTQALNHGFRLEPFVQDKAAKCHYCRDELKGPCASRFSQLYKCAQAHGKMIGAQECDAVRQNYVCVIKIHY